MQLIGSFQIPAQHPCLSGHFPEHPIVPGVVLLEQVEKLLKQHLPEWAILEVSQTKFLEVALPDEEIEISFDTSKLMSHENITFQLIHPLSSKKVASGKLQLSQMDFG